MEPIAAREMENIPYVVQLGTSGSGHGAPLMVPGDQPWDDSFPGGVFLILVQRGT